MDRLLRNILMFYSLTGLYLDLATDFWSWRRCYPWVVTLAVSCTMLHHLGVTFFKGLLILYTRVSSDEHETAKLINSLGPITSKMIIISTLIIYTYICLVYFNALRHSRKLIECLTHQIYRSVWFSRSSAWLGLGLILSLEFSFAYSVFTGKLTDNVLRNLAFLIGMLSIGSHYMFYAYITIYFVIVNIRCLDRMHKACQASTKGVVFTINHLCLNVERFCDNVSLPLCFFFLNNLLQGSFNLSFVYFQNHSKAIFVGNVVGTMSINLVTLLVLCVLSQLLPLTFDRLYRRANKCKIPAREHWRVECFLLSEERSRLQPRIFRLVEVSLSTFVSLVLYSFEFGIVITQTEYSQS